MRHRSRRGTYPDVHLCVGPPLDNQQQQQLCFCVWISPASPGFVLSLAFFSRCTQSLPGVPTPSPQEVRKHKHDRLAAGYKMWERDACSIINQTGQEQQERRRARVLAGADPGGLDLQRSPRAAGGLRLRRLPAAGADAGRVRCGARERERPAASEPKYPCCVCVGSAAPHTYRCP